MLGIPMKLYFQAFKEKTLDDSDKLARYGKFITRTWINYHWETTSIGSPNPNSSTLLGLIKSP
jgi:hypothetical protein